MSFNSVKQCADTLIHSDYIVPIYHLYKFENSVRTQISIFIALLQYFIFLGVNSNNQYIDELFFYCKHHSIVDDISSKT